MWKKCRCKLDIVVVERHPECEIHKTENEVIERMKVEADYWRNKFNALETEFHHTQMELQLELQKAQDLRNAECGNCGRALPPDGDCFGCSYDLAIEKIKGLQQRLDNWRDSDSNEPI